MKRGGRRATPGSFAGVIAAYIGSDKFMRLAPSTQENYKRHLALAQSVLGARDVEVMRPALTQAFLDGLADRPSTQKVAQTALKALERWAIVRDLLPRQITIGTEAPGGSGGHKPWTDDQVTIGVEHAAPHISRVITLAANTGQRGSDLVRMRWSDIETYDGRIGLNVVTKKVGLQLWIPLTDELNAALTAWERRPGFILLKPDGQPWSRHQLSDAWTRERDTNPALAPLAGCTLHGLRATAIVRLRRAGVSTGLISSLVGLSENMVNRYCRFAVQKDNAIAAVIQLDGTARERIKANRTKTSAKAVDSISLDVLEIDVDDNIINSLDRVNVGRTEQKMADQGIPQTAKEFEHFADGHRAMWPPHLADLAHVALLTLNLMDQPNFEKSPAIVALSKAALVAFREAYAKHKGGK